MEGDVATAVGGHGNECVAEPLKVNGLVAALLSIL
jgi:hypothetical protein